MHQLTQRDATFAHETASRINKDYPGSATVLDGKCFITDEHWEYCKQYVLDNCKIK